MKEITTIGGQIVLINPAHVVALTVEGTQQNRNVVRIHLSGGLSYSILDFGKDERKSLRAAASFLDHDLDTAD